MPEHAPRSCSSCGTELSVGARFCAACGARVTPVAGPVSWNVADRRYFGVLPGARFFTAVRRRVARLWAVARSRLRFALAVAATRVRAMISGLGLRRAAARLSAERAQRVHALGEAVYREDNEETELDGRLRALEEEMQRIDRSAQERIERAQQEGGPTEVVDPLPPETVPEPPIVPEPEPVPHVPPGPVIVPEPEPVPHEPPGPVIVPEPQPPIGVTLS
jgi:hypothetical protein